MPWGKYRMPETLVAQEPFLTYEPLIRLGRFRRASRRHGVVELLAPRLRQEIGRARRWPSNLGVVVLDMLAVRILFDRGASAWPWSRKRAASGLFQAIAAPRLVAVILSIILLDLAIYLQHVLFPRGAGASGGFTGRITPISNST